MDLPKRMELAVQEKLDYLKREVVRSRSLKGSTCSVRTGGFAPGMIKCQIRRT
jgi:hypothetical protein